MSTAVAKSEPRNVGAWFRRGPLGSLREEMEELFSRALGEEVACGRASDLFRRLIWQKPMARSRFAWIFPEWRPRISTFRSTATC